jgi:hypothetical protein
MQNSTVFGMSRTHVCCERKKVKRKVVLPAFIIIPWRVPQFRAPPFADPSHITSDTEICVTKRLLSGLLQFAIKLHRFYRWYGSNSEIRAPFTYSDCCPIWLYQYLPAIKIPPALPHTPDSVHAKEACQCPHCISYRTI